MAKVSGVGMEGCGTDNTGALDFTITSYYTHSKHQALHTVILRMAHSITRALKAETLTVSPIYK